MLIESIIPEKILTKRIEDLNLIVMTYPKLRGMEMKTIKDLLEADPQWFRTYAFEPYELKQIDNELENLMPGLYPGILCAVEKMVSSITSK